MFLLVSRSSRVLNVRSLFCFTPVSAHGRLYLTCGGIFFRSGDGNRSRSHTPDSLSSSSDPGMNHSVMAGSPTMHQKIRAIGGVPTAFASVSPIVRRSNPSTPTRQNTGRPDFIGLAQCGVIQVPHAVRVPQTASYNYGPYHSANGERRLQTDAKLIPLNDRQYRVLCGLTLFIIIAV